MRCTTLTTALTTKTKSFRRVVCCGCGGSYVIGVCVELVVVMVVGAVEGYCGVVNDGSGIGRVVVDIFMIVYY